MTFLNGRCEWCGLIDFDGTNTSRGWLCRSCKEEMQS